MVTVIKAPRGPRVEIHTIEHIVDGQHVFNRVYGELKIAAKEVVYARELGLNTLQVFLLQPESGAHHPFPTNVWIYHKGEYDNYASVDIFSMDGYQYEAATRGQSAETAPSTLPYDGSLWFGFVAIGE
jgi:hypothetical protein